jgi:hypothetical protein
MKTIQSVAFEWSADDVQRAIDNLPSDEQLILESRIDNQYEFLENVIEENKFAIIGFINDLIKNAINEF